MGSATRERTGSTTLREPPKSQEVEAGLNDIGDGRVRPSRMKTTSAR